jgi:effector-binding domain-containing protein
VIGPVAVLDVPERPTAVIAAETTWELFPTLWRGLLDEVWGAVRGSATIRPGRNVMVYRDELPHVEVGVEAASAFAPLGRVVPSSLPGGRAAMVLLRGSYDELPAAHRRLEEACDGRGLRRLGPRWELYGHVTPEGPVEVEVYCLLA